ncbi:hypothetical protein B0H14DRAFT_2898766 [Mycena olivaceomarginata]|nr:hypothetical protein B0H14DRAFT_2898766 [Mycena olivaceomarginata]
MGRIAPNLVYLTIYNPTLRPSGPIAPDDEDAEEQAHILFYTSKERAVSRDRMLRQVGLAKALISFSDMFNADDVCNNVHSQAKRMIMVSPEPDFWIHAGIEIAKTPRQPADKSKGKGKEKTKGEQPLLYDYHEHSVHDVAVQADIIRGYEKFKLRHGSFASILSSLGQEALELQLERFFTVWAWSWNLEDGPEFGEHLGPPLHPMQGFLLPHIDDFSSRLPDEVVAIAVSPPYVIPSTRYTALSYPADDGTKTFLGMHLDVHLDMPKWNWLTFGKNSSKKAPGLLAVTPAVEAEQGDFAAAAAAGKAAAAQEGAGARLGVPPLDTDTPGSESTINFEVEVDRSALEDAMYSERIPLPSSPPVEKVDTDVRSLSETIVPPKDENEHAAEEAAVADAAEDASTPEEVPAETTTEQSERSLPPAPEPEPEPEQPPAEFASTTNAQTTKRRRLFYLIRDRVLVALIDLADADPFTPDSAELVPLAQDAAGLAAALATAMEDDDIAKSVDTLPSATKILQPKDRYALSAAGLAVHSPEFKSRSGHLYAARQRLLASDPTISEVFSRGQNPQHWHVARRADDGAEEEEVYMEVFRKEASLTDVDNALAGVVRKSRLALQPQSQESGLEAGA